MDDTPLRYEVEDGGGFVEFSPSWKRGEIRAFWAETTGRDEWLALVRSKITALQLGSLTSPAQLTEDGLDELDYSLFAWFQNVCMKAVADVTTLGEAYGRRLWATAGEAQADRPTPS